MSRHYLVSIGLGGVALAGLIGSASAPPLDTLTEVATVAAPSNKKVLLIGTDGTRHKMVHAPT